MQVDDKPADQPAAVEADSGSSQPSGELASHQSLHIHTYPTYLAAAPTALISFDIICCQECRPQTRIYLRCCVAGQVMDSLWAETIRKLESMDPEVMDRHRLVLHFQQQRTAVGVLENAVQHEQQLDAVLLTVCFSKLAKHSYKIRQQCRSHPGMASLLAACQKAPLSPAQAVSIAAAAAELKPQLPSALLDRLMVLASDSQLGAQESVDGLTAFAALDTRPDSAHLEALLLRVVTRLHASAKHVNCALAGLVKHSKRPDIMLLASASSWADALPGHACPLDVQARPSTLPCVCFTRSQRWTSQCCSLGCWLLLCVVFSHRGMQHVLRSCVKALLGCSNRTHSACNSYAVPS